MSAPKKKVVSPVVIATALYEVYQEVEAFLTAHPELASFEAEMAAAAKTAIEAWVAAHTAPAPLPPQEPAA